MISFPQLRYGSQKRITQPDPCNFMQNESAGHPECSDYNRNVSKGADGRNLIIFLFQFLLFPFWGIGQDCSLTIRGALTDEGTGIPMAFATIYIEEVQAGVAADSSGKYLLKNLCPGEYHLQVNHIGCEAKIIFIELKNDTSINIRMHHHNELVDEVVIHEEHHDHGTQSSVSIKKEQITEIANKDLSEMLESMTGVSTLKSGAGISKPVIHGLSGNRVTVLNNGVPQSGQQWGNDHAPEIDPYVADHLSVIKGASALAYMGSSLGGVVLVEPDAIGNDPHLHGEANYIFQTNGLGHTVNARLEKNDKWAAWRVSGTAKVIGDRSAPTHYLTNTGKREYNGALQIEKKYSSHWNMKLFYSQFYTEIGVLRGSHIGNLTDLEDALVRDEPLFTEDHFSYSINAPRQTVNHHLLKLESNHIFNDYQSFHIRYAGQLNNRKEFDIRRGERTDIPSLSLNQWEHFGDALYRHFFKNHSSLKVGAQFKFTDNVNNPETGILPLIPNYRAYRAGTFAVYQKEAKRLSYEFGARYDLVHLRVVTISSTLPRKIERFNHTYHNYSFSGGMKYEVLRNLKLNLELGHILRSPEINELYSGGLHQGVSGIEEGNRNLGSERSIKAVFNVDWSVRKKLFIQALGYYQYVNNFIYLQPEEDFRLTIRGAFPVFSYQQTDAILAGADLLISYEPIESIRLLAKYSFLQGDDVSNDQPLVYMPSNNLFGSVSYSLKDGEKRKNTSFSINGRYVFKQNHLNADQDFLPPPEGYFLLGASVGTSVKLKRTTLRISLNGENLLNIRYRDYLNRQRYFADDLGWNLNLRLGLSF